MANSSAVLKYMADDLRAISKLNQSYRYGLKIGVYGDIEDYIRMGFFSLNLKRLNKRIDMALEVIEHQTTNHTFIPQIIENIFEDLKEVYPMPEKFLVGVDFAQFPEENIELLWKFADQLEHLSTVLDFKYGLHQDPDEPRPSYWKDYNIDFDNILNKVESGEWTFQTIQNRYGALFERDQEFKDMFLRHLSQSFHKVGLGRVLEESEKVKDERIRNVDNTIKRMYGDVGVYIQPTPKKNPFENDFKEITDGVINGRLGHIKVKEYLKEWRTETPNIISMFLNYLNQVIYTYNRIGEEKKEKILTELHDNILATFNNDSGIEKNQPEPKTTADFSHIESFTPTNPFDMGKLYRFLIQEGVIRNIDKQLFSDCITHGHINELWENGVKSKLKLVCHRLKDGYGKEWFQKVCENLNLSAKDMGKFNLTDRKRFEQRLFSVIQKP